MPFLQSLAERWPIPSVRDLEASHFETQSGPYPEFEHFGEKPAPAEEQGEEAQPSKLEQRAASSISWLSRTFARSQATINHKREALLSSSRESSSGRSSTDDVESQVSTDASTLLENEDEAKVVVKKSSSRVDARLISDAIIGLSDGLTVPFALTAGLSALGNTQVVIFAGLAELTAGAISMGLGGYLGAKSEEESYKATLTETRHLVSTSSTNAATSIKEVFEPYDLPQNLSEGLTFHLAKSPHLTQFLMHFQHSQPEQAASRAITCAMTIACGYFLGGFIPLLPYFLVGKDEVMLALWCSLGVMAVSLFVFGYGKTCFVYGWHGSRNVWEGTKGGLQMIIVGGLAAGCAMGLVRLFHGLGE
ncbi:Protein ccc1 [Recurvomyces mirabilis]|uniref:Protein ccc1 n=1 Tax=Recurvomyces mirabilis TaxID=574656 RepID=A0AAE0TS11_9PEZI|nr:Protein ccc1 [Recurvomyces mirabilis]KAK5150630.1 Protein ccc1 [Recurvomyces mirabilis]